METIQAVARGQEAMTRIQEEMNQKANVVAATTTIDPPMPPQGNPTIQILVSTPCGAPTPAINPSIIEIDDQHDALFSPRADSLNDAFAPPTAEVEKKVCTTKEKLKAMKVPNDMGLDADEICLMPGVRIPTKFKVPNFEKYKGASNPRTHIRSYCWKMDAYSDDERLLMHFF